jgi:hypothetical protein
MASVTQNLVACSLLNLLNQRTVFLSMSYHLNEQSCLVYFKIIFLIFLILISLWLKNNYKI